MKKITLTLVATLPVLLLQATATTLEFLDERKRKADYKIRAETCSRDYANMTVFKMYQENRITEVDQMKAEWEFAYMTHHLEH